jgi:NAD(P)-dependent dehydrogenase (short-subunit alcohol dehydrogenase family)
MPNLFQVNVFGLLDTTQAFLPLLRQDQGRIVNIGSVAGLIALDGSGGRLHASYTSPCVRVDVYPSQCTLAPSLPWKR